MFENVGSLFGVSLDECVVASFYMCHTHTHTHMYVIIMVVFMCYFSREHIALSINKNHNSVNIALGRTIGLKALCMMQINA